MKVLLRAAVLLLAPWLALPSLVAQEGQPLFDLRFEARRLSFEELARLVPALEQVQLPPGFTITKLEATGPMERLSIELVAGSSGSSIRAQAIVDAREPGRSAKGRATLEGVDLAGLLQRPTLPTDVTADAEFDVRFAGEDGQRIEGTFGLRAPALAMAGYRARDIRVTGRIDGTEIRFDGRLAAYGASVTAEGRASFGDALQYDVSGRVARVDLRRLPAALEVPALASDLNLAYQVSDRGEGLRGRIAVARSTLTGARIAPDTIATFEQRGEDIHYRAEGGLSGVNLQRVGRALEIEALDAARFDSVVNARFRVQGRGAQVDPAEVTITDSTIFGGRIPALRLRAAMSATALTFAADGGFEQWDAGALLERDEVQGILSGSLEVEGSLPRTSGGWQADRLDARGRLTLAPSSIEGIQIAEGVVAGRLIEGSLVRLERATITGEGLALRASGDVGLDGSRPTSLEYFVDTPPLGALTDVTGVDATGDLTLDGRVTGGELLEIAGTLAGRGLGYGEHEASEVSATYTVSLPRSDPSAARVKSRTSASDLVLAGREYDGLTAETTYDEGLVSFDAELSGADESLAAAGRLDWQAERQRVELTALGLRTADAAWQLAGGSEPVIEYGGEGVGISDLRLVSAPDQAIALDGRIGDGNETLKVTLTNVSVAPFAMLAGREDLAGRVTAEATIGGTLEEPTVQATFGLSETTVQGVELRLVEGRVGLGGERLSFDARVVRPDESWLRAAGEVPAAVVRGAGRTAEGPLDVTIESSSIGLDLVRTFTDRVDEVAGTLQVDARVTGTMADPRPDGGIRISGGAFTIPELGTQYDRLDADILLERQAVVIDRFRLVDDDGDELTVTGRLPIEKLQVGEVDLALRANGLEVIDNELGDVEIAADLQVAGALTGPRVTGRVQVTEGTLNVDEILTLGGEDAYAVRAREQGLVDPDAGAAPEGLLAGVPVALDVELEAPLLLRGRDIRAPGGSSVGLGNLNLNAEGALTLQKSLEGPLRITGSVEMVRGAYEFQGRDFELVRGGAVRFAGLPEINPILDVSARREISGVETLVHVGGTMDAPTLSLTSNPPLDEADILSLIVFNQPANSLGAGEQVSLSARASALASGFIAGQLTEAIGGVMDVDLLEIEAGGAAGGLGPVVTIGEQFGDLFVRLQQQFGSQSRSRVVVEYAITEWMRLESSFVDDRGTVQPLLRRQADSGVDAVFSFEY